MKIFEFHFSPKAREDLIFDSFCYEPENVYEERLGSLFLVGELKNNLPQNLKFLDNLAGFLKKQYYFSPVRFSPEAGLKESLKKTNDFLEKIVKSGDVSWLGNLNSAVFNLALYHGKRWEINFTKTGTIKILLLRGGEIIDISKNLELQDFEPYPLKIYGNIVSGKLVERDIVLVLTENIFSVFAEVPAKFRGGRQKPKKGKSLKYSPTIIEQIAAVMNFEKGDEGKKIKEILKTKEKELLETSGICLLCILTKEAWSADKKPKIFTFQKEVEKFSIGQVFSPMVNKLKEIPKKFLKLRKPKIHLPESLKKNLVSVSLLIFFLLLGFFIFKREEEAKLKKYQIVLTTAQQDISQAENFLFLKEKEKAFAIFKKAREEILALTERKSAIQKEAITLKASLEEKLAEISNLEKIPEPELFFEFDQGDEPKGSSSPFANTRVKDFLPQKMAYLGGNLYFYNSFSDNVYKLNQNAEKSLLRTLQRFNRAAEMRNSLLFFKKPNLIIPLKDDQFGEELLLQSPYPDFDPQDFAAYQSNLYFLDGKNGEIIKYSGPLSAGKDSPQLWLNPATKKANDVESLAVSGSVWTLRTDNTISRYFGGDFQNSLTLNLFPFLKNLSKISSQAGLLYLLEPAQSRIIILTTAGKVIKQFQSEKFNNLMDFSVSSDGKTIWLLNGTKIYQIKF